MKKTKMVRGSRIPDLRITSAHSAIHTTDSQHCWFTALLISTTLYPTLLRELDDVRSSFFLHLTELPNWNQNSPVAFIMQDTQSETSGQSETQGKWNGVSWLNQANREEWLLPYFISYELFYLLRIPTPGKRTGFLKWSGKLRPNRSSPRLEAVPNSLVWRNQNAPFHLTYDQNFRNLRHDGKHLTIFVFKEAFNCVSSNQSDYSSQS